MKIIALALLLALPFTTPAPKLTIASPDDSWTKEELRMANTAGNANYLTAEEKDMVIYMNLARMDGARFFDTYFQDFLDAYNMKVKQYGNYNELKLSRNDSYYRSLRRDLEQVANFPVFWPDQALTNIAKGHAKDLNRNNYAGHTSKDGRTLNQRISTAYPKKSNGECIAFGFNTGLENVCMLLLDRGVPDLGHRKLILNKSAELNTVGLSIQPHPRYRYCAVIDFVSLPD
ncbi:CAP domain-containing protein [Pedobacter gandavensis]|uniref:CAP domain-containing protein n=1 Tax=Pedobacter gandavensis TaxID=2679963 RepID=A0ABR6F2T1_9SPHI|nr:CAP domain-containing protein [Pedobacter gandavensis]MBB2151527.1 CAP domain-containing protein [Pedobacter gandavensis]